MLKVFRPSSEVVKEGRILEKIKYLMRLSGGVFVFTQDIHHLVGGFPLKAWSKTAQGIDAKLSRL